MPHDRDEVLSRISLPALADELLGPHKGRGSSASWSCPAPGHGSQTGRTPPVTVFRAQSGDERWRCHACSAGGTAADLVMVTRDVGFREAIEMLAGRVGFVGYDQWSPSVIRPAKSRSISSPASAAVGPEIECYVAACEGLLWEPEGRPMRQWLSGRGLEEEILRANRVGADPGPLVIDRARGLPRSGPAVVLPVLDADDRAVYVQARYLDPPNGRKYDNPSVTLAGLSPRLAEARLATAPVDPSTVLVCEGLPDSLTAAQAGYRSIAVLGAGLPDERVASQLAQRFPTDRLLVAFDADDRGRAGSQRLVDLLDEVGAGDRIGTVEVPGVGGDLNGWQLVSDDSFRTELAEAVERASAQRDATVAVDDSRGPSLDDLLEAIHYEHILVDDRIVAATNLSRIRDEVRRWDAAEPQSIGHESSSTDLLDERLELVAYHHLLVDDPACQNGNLARIRSTIDDWAPVRQTPAMTEAWLAQGDISPATAAHATIRNGAVSSSPTPFAPPPLAPGLDHAPALEL